MQEKYNDQFEKQIKILTQSNVEAGKYKVLDYQSRIVARAKFPELVNTWAHRKRFLSCDYQ